MALVCTDDDVILGVRCFHDGIYSIDQEVFTDIELVVACIRGCFALGGLIASDVHDVTSRICDAAHLLRGVCGCCLSELYNW